MSSCLQFTYPCLGRSPEIGTLYDCRTELFIPEVKLWDPEALSGLIRNEATNKTNVSVKDSLQCKFKSLDMDDNTSLSFLAGMIPVKGGAENLLSETALSDEIQVVVEYHYTRNLATVPKHQLKTEKQTEFDKCFAATHVVTGVEYGVDAFFVFRRKRRSNEIDGNAEKALIQVINKSMYESVELLEDEKQQVNELKCTYYGDISLPKLPTSFQEAIDVFKTYFMSNQEPMAIPKKVNLLPLRLMGSKLTGMYFSINNGAIQMCIKILEQTKTILSEAKELQQSCIYEYLPGINAQLEKFCATVSNFQSKFQKTLQESLPKIRSGELGEQELLLQIAEWEESPFTWSRLRSWIVAKKEERSILEGFFKQLEANIPNIRIAKRQADLIPASANNQIMYYSFGEELAEENHIFLDELEMYLTANGVNLIGAWDENHEWYNNDHRLRCAKNQLESFLSFAQINSKSELDLAAITFTDRLWKRLAKDFGSILLFSNSTWQTFQPPSPPLNIQLEKAESESLQISWNPPEMGTKHVTEYSVMYHPKELKEGMKNAQTKGQEICLSNLIPDTSYIVMVRSVCGIGSSKECSFEVKTKPNPPLVSLFQNNLREVRKGSSESKQIFELKMIKVLDDPTNCIKVYEMGKPDELQLREEKVVMLIGGTGDGKTTFLNAMVNYIFGVSMEDPFILQVVSHQESHRSQAFSQTSDITAYRIYWHKYSRLPYTIVIIDTPGLDDVAGLERQREIVLKQLREFFKMNDKRSVDHLDCVGFVCNSTLPRLTPGRKYIYLAVLEVFGKDMIDNICMLFTFADGTKPGALTALKEDDVPFNKYYTFNNCVFTKTWENKNGNAGSYWEMAYRSAKMFFDDLKQAKSQSLILTCENLEARKRLEVKILSLQQRVQEGVNELVRMKQEVPIIKNYVAEKKANENYKRKVKVPKIRKQPKPIGTYVTCCMTCSKTCHEDCRISDDKLKYKCHAMKDKKDIDTHCTVCNCHWTQHSNTPYFFVHYEEEEYMSIADLKKKYDGAVEGLTEKGRILTNFFRRFDQTQLQVLDDVKEIRELLHKLNEIALKYNPITVKEYLQSLINHFEREKKPGWDLKIQQLQAAKDRAEMMADLSKQQQSYDPFSKIKEEIRKEFSGAMDDVSIKQAILPVLQEQEKLCRVM